MWSLPFEVQMYLLLPFVYALGKRFRNQVLVLAIVCAFWYGCRRLSPEWGLFQFMPWFFMGTAAYFQPPRARFPRSWYYSALTMVVGLPLAYSFLRGFHGFELVELACCAVFSFAI